MEFKLKFDLPESAVNLTYDDFFVLIGSCFSDEIGAKLNNAGFNTESNTFGTLFHPSAIANVIKASLEESKSVDVFQRDDLFFSWDAASKVYASSEKNLIDSVVKLRKQLCDDIKAAGTIIITFGTAWEYQLTSTGKTVGNCHKASQSLFDKSLTSIDEMSIQWKELIELIRNENPDVKIIFTVSPVRHLKDGLIDNNRSKARLIELVNELTSSTNTFYFPSYEILIDELRDYRFYDDDLIHPSKNAVDYIWECFSENSFTTETQSIMKERAKIISQLNHKSLHPNSQAELKRMEIAKLRVEEFKTKFPSVNF